ncbi:hypothetical protein Trydic_g10197 [Trypoxylus dichotomus]
MSKSAIGVLADTYDEVLPSTSAGEQQQQQHSGDNNAKPPALCFVSRMKERFHEFKQMLNTISTNYYVQFASVPGAPKKGIIQCKKCQARGHAAANCFLKVMRCVECVEEHRSFMCKKPPSTTPLQPLQTRNVNRDNKLLLFKAVLRPILTYAPIFASPAKTAGDAKQMIATGTWSGSVHADPRDAPRRRSRHAGQIRRKERDEILREDTGTRKPVHSWDNHGTHRKAPPHIP